MVEVSTTAIRDLDGHKEEDAEEDDGQIRDTPMEWKASRGMGWWRQKRMMNACENA